MERNRDRRSEPPRASRGAETRLWLSPPEVARERGIGVSKVLGWIKSGQLDAVNCAASADGQPRWRVSREALAAFDRQRKAVRP